VNRIVIVGASAAGLAAAETLRREGFAGTVTLIGGEIDLPYDRPPLSKQILSSQWEAERLSLRSAAHLAAVARGLGCDVVLLEPAPVPLAHAVGERIGRMLSDVHRGQGVDLRTGVAVAEVADGGVRLAGGELVEADEVLVAIGSQPNTEWLARSGLHLDDGVVCDAFLQAAPGIYAAGDVARWPNPLFGVPMRIEHRTNAAEQGMAAARNLLHPEARKPFAPVPYFWSDQYDIKLHAYGYLPGHDTVEIVEGDVEQRRFLAAYHRAGRLVGALAVGMPPKSIRPWRQAIAAAATTETEQQ
jgi:NADPH-dependent 2,4-dienoyl-CoA reductase/sulfur reductase-like enzyme